MLCFIIFIINICIHLFVYFFDYPPRPLYKVVKKIYTFFITFLIIYISKITSNARSALRVILRPGAAKRHKACTPLVPILQNLTKILPHSYRGKSFVIPILQYFHSRKSVQFQFHFHPPPTTHNFIFICPYPTRVVSGRKLSQIIPEIGLFYYCQMFDLCQKLGTTLLSTTTPKKLPPPTSHHKSCYSKKMPPQPPFSLFFLF